MSFYKLIKINFIILIIFVTLLVLVNPLNLFNLNLAFNIANSVKAENETDLQIIQKQKLEKEKKLKETYKQIDQIKNSNISISEKIKQIDKQVESLKIISKDLQTDIDKILSIYLKKQEQITNIENQLNKSRVDLYLQRQKTIPQMVLSSTSFKSFLNNMWIFQANYNSLNKKTSILKQEIIVQQNTLKTAQDQKLQITNDLINAENQLADLKTQQNQLASDLLKKNQLKNNLNKEIVDLSNQAQKIVDEKSRQNNTPPDSGAGNGNTNNPVDTQNPELFGGDYFIFINEKRVNKILNGPIRFIMKDKGYFSVGNYSYRDTLEFRRDTNVYIINELPLQTYLYGLAEMPSSWPIEALKAQATAGRTYAIANLNKRTSNKYNLRDDVNDQNYNGVNKELEKTYGQYWVKAVDESKNKILKSNRALISTYYHSTCGGHTLSSKEVWGGDRSFAQAKSDRYLGKDNLWHSYDEKSSYSLWKAGDTTMTSAYIIDIINTAIYLQYQNSSTTAQNNVACPLNKLDQKTGVCSKNNATVFTSQNLKDNLKTNAIEAKVGKITSIKQIYDDTNTNKIGQNSKYTKELEITGDKSTIKISGPIFKMAYNLRSPGSNWLASTLFDIQKQSSEDWRFLSRGYGHRVGMCQYGAYGRANAGFTYDQILKYYYTGTYLEDYNMNTKIRIGITKTGGTITTVRANQTYEIYDKNGLITTINKDQLVKIGR